MVFGLTTSQIVPWIAVLPILLLTMSWGVQRALGPLREIGDELRHRQPDALHPLDDRVAPTELKPLIGAMNGLFSRIDAMVKRERRFTADAAHELRTPLAVLRAQWDVVRRAQSPVERAGAEEKLTAGMDRMVAFADDDRVRTLLTEAGFESISIERFDTPVILGASPRAAADSSLRMGPTARLAREVGEQHAATIRHAVESALSPFAGEDGRVRLTGSTWIVSATNGA
jgi:signal transduction histidine kinase